ncbi:MAG: galactose ABC transporter substrate-binding protein [Synergistaceae bacterium]|nr:galactose ABC transporter substrate-binding protein [Synergistaceae bacterium]
MKSEKIRMLSTVCMVLLGIFAEAAAFAGVPNIAALIYKYDDTYVSTVRNALSKAFDGKANLTMKDGEGQQAIQNDQLDVVIEKKMDGIIVNMVDAQAAGGVVEKIKAAGIPVVFFNREPDLNVLKGYDKAVFVGTNVVEAGKLQGDIIKSLWDANPNFDLNKDGQFQYVMFKGEPDNPEAIARTEFSVKQAEANGVKMAQIGETFVCNWDTAQAETAMESALASNEGKIELVIANNDAMALGAIAALSGIGYNVEGGSKFIPVIGVDATNPAVDAIGKGIMSGTVKLDGEAMGEAIAAIMLNMTAGKAPLDGTQYTYDDSGIAVRIPYSPYVK